MLEGTCILLQVVRATEPKTETLVRHLLIPKPDLTYGLMRSHFSKSEYLPSHSASTVDTARDADANFRDCGP